MSESSSDARRLAEARIGTVLREKWRLDRVLGTGGFGAVYAATHRTGKRVAVKLLHPELSFEPEVRKRFLREAYAANAVDHPGAVSVLDDDVTDEGAAFLVMDLLEGETLEARRLRKGGALPPAEVLSIADQVLDVLAAAHGKGVIHRDLKPENVFLTRDGKIKLLDFGIARMREPKAGGATTQLGAVMGTPAFMPPEQARGRWELVDGRTDLWALGATLFTLLSGRFVHGDLNMYEALGAAMMKPAPPVASAVPGLPAQVAAVIDRALAYDREARWPDARAMQAGVREAYSAWAGAAPLVTPRASVPDAEEATTLPRGAPANAPKGVRVLTEVGAQAAAGVEGTRAVPATVPGSPMGSTSVPLVRLRSTPAEGAESRRAGRSTGFVVGLGMALAVGLIAGIVFIARRTTTPAQAPETNASAPPEAAEPLAATASTPVAASTPAAASAPAATASAATSASASVPTATAAASPRPKPTGSARKTTKSGGSPLSTPY